MANWNTLKTAICSVIRENGNQEITGSNLQNTLMAIVSALGENRSYAGLATPNSVPTNQDGPVFYIASAPGVYQNFGGLRVADGDFALIVNTESGWQIEAFKLNTFIKGSVDIGPSSTDLYDYLADCLVPGFYEVLSFDEKVGFLLTTSTEIHGSYHQYLFGGFQIMSNAPTLVETGADLMDNIPIFTRYLNGPDYTRPWRLVAPQKIYSSFNLATIEDAIQNGQALSRSALTTMLTPDWYTYSSQFTVWPSVGDVLGKGQDTYLVVAAHETESLGVSSVRISFIQESGIGTGTTTTSSYDLYTLQVYTNSAGLITQCALLKASIPLELIGKITPN